MNFYVASTDDRYFFLNSAVIDEDPTLLDNLSSNCINFVTKDGQKISVLKNSPLPNQVQNILESSNQNTFSDVTLELSDVVQISDLPHDLAKRTNNAAEKNLLLKKVEEKDSPISAAKRGDLKKLNEFEKSGQTLTLREYIESSTRKELAVLKWFYEKNSNEFLKADSIPYSIDKDQAEIWNWCRSIGMLPNEQKLYLAINTRNSGIINILNLAYDRNEKINLEEIAFRAISSQNLDVLYWVLERLENPESIDKFIAHNREPRDERIAAILNAYKKQMLL